MSKIYLGYYRYYEKKLTEVYKKKLRGNLPRVERFELRNVDITDRLEYQEASSQEVVCRISTVDSHESDSVLDVVHHRPE